MYRNTKNKEKKKKNEKGREEHSRRKFSFCSEAKIFTGSVALR